MPFININQINIYYIDNKIAGTPLVFIHGWLGSSLEWIYQFHYFNSRRHIIFIDLPGYGRSDKPKVNYSIEFFTELILEFLKTLDYHEIILIGHSLGGLISQNITLTNPNIVKKLILISTPPPRLKSIKNKCQLILLNVFFRVFYSKLLNGIIKQILSSDFEKDFKKFRAYVSKLPKSVVFSTFKNMTVKFSINEELRSITQPTLIINGEKDQIIHKTSNNNLSDSIPASRIFIIENSPHRVMVKDYKKVNKIIEDFI